MEIPFFLIGRKQFSLYRKAADIIFRNSMFSCFFKLADALQNDFRRKILHSFHHDDEIVPAVIHVMDVSLTEVTSVQDEPDLPVSITSCPLQHVLQLRDINDTSAVVLIEQRFAVI